MDINLKEALSKYKMFTIQLIEALEKEDYDSLEELLNKRQELIEYMNSLSYSKEEFRALCDEFQILILQQRLNSIMNEKRSKVKSEIDKLQLSKNANKNYNKGFKPDSIFFNKEI